VSRICGLTDFIEPPPTEDLQLVRLRIVVDCSGCWASRTPDLRYPYRG
jgi:hypothetical protein